ncbi:DNA-processing protein DprA [Comamonas flocculans]|uniref:DNA-protecting protein DprA n=1 Tax=Comamonas flocculans TaxID=2597701 RepID=A0A5B8RY63_9BURK|nr:DNA-processing protein DprA [Comamonas flocculans]QEA12807.1 DNA-protecting protein DprA [Comamonas flocculans]
MQPGELAAWLRLTTAKGLGAAAARRLLGHFGLPEAVFAHGVPDWGNCLNGAQASSLARHHGPELDALVQRTRQWLETSPGPGIARALVTLADGNYPHALLCTEDPPVLLYAEGSEACLHADALVPAASLAIVGSRSPSAQGVQNARAFGRALREAGLCIVSGLARGVDGAAHEGALAAAPGTGPDTVAVVGTGLDQVYPRAHQALARRIAERGLLLSEYPLGTPPLPANFPRRNRILSGLTRGTLVVEAALASGSLVTARLASEQGREVFAIPGSIHAPQSRGCHALIRQGAKLVETAQDILEELALPGLRAQAQPAPEAGAGAPEAQDPVLRALGFDPLGIDALMARTGMDAASLQLRLLELELAGNVARLPGGLFQQTAST